ncbi:MAG TPA: anaerobic ribonucleoside-triphosphate reductase activating protein [Candidatus Moranbacteria bacterium]|nr:anaerobic ribonucleoside-triphosphate reductase activating protein [Candidatus Moranbacteria bacterium]
MRLGGFQKITLIDCPGKIGTTVFTVGCNFRCPFCHNPELVLPEQYAPSLPENTEESFLKFLKERKGRLEGVCITGGEPTIQPDIINFIQKIKKIGYAVKLDTNGSRPDVLEKVIHKRIVDFISMDIKSSPQNYAKLAGVKMDMDKINLSISLIMHSPINYEFRTTAVPGMHTEKDFEEIAHWLKGAKKYCLQKYRDIKILNPRLKKATKGKSLDLEKIKKNIEKSFGEVEVRN